MDKDRAKSAAALRRAAASPKVRAVLLTVDLPVVSKREADERVRMAAADVNANTGVAVSTQPARGFGFARQTGSFIDPDLSWADVAWVRRALTAAAAADADGRAPRPPLPLLLKGVQTAEDARRACRAGVDGIVLSNHGGRAADTAPPAILTLLELHRCCPEVLGAVAVLVDGGFRRGSDVVKALSLGAAAVGIGRPFLYALGYGRDGVEHAIDSECACLPTLLPALVESRPCAGVRGRRTDDVRWQVVKDEIETAMRLCGMADLMRDAHPDLVNTADIDHLVPGPGGHPYARKITSVVKPRL